MSEQTLDPVTADVSADAPTEDTAAVPADVDTTATTSPVDVAAAEPPPQPPPTGFEESDDGAPGDTAWVVRLITSIVVVGVTTLVAVLAMHPRLIFTNNTPTGGDMGAHVWGPAYLRDHLLPQGQLTGWSMDWYSGLPSYRFYMVVPALLIILLNVVLPYGIAFKIVAVLGIVTLPLCCWAFGRLARMPFPVPEMFAVVGLIYLFDESYTIYGGNIASTMAGEFSFSISLSLAMLGFGLMLNGLQTGRHRVKTSIVIALAVLCHGIVAIFVVVGLILMGAIYADGRRLWYWFTTCGAGALLSCFWIVPFMLNHAYMTDMKYQGEPGSGSFDSYWDMFFALPPFWDVFFTTLAVIGLVVAVVRRNMVAAWIGVTGVVFSSFVFFFRDSLPVIGLLWNPRLLPFVNMCRYLLAAYAIHEIVQAVVRGVRRARYVDSVSRSVATYGEQIPAWALPRAPRTNSLVAGAVTAGVFLTGTLAVLGFRFQELPFDRYVQDADGTTRYVWGPTLGPLEISTESTDDGFVDGWARWNFTGYEGIGLGPEERPKPYYGEYRAVVQAMKEIGEDPAYGCGRALWENFEGNDSYGTSMALMLLPFWTDSCIGSSEGLFFEASGTTPYHFLAAAAMSKQSSNPVRELRYENNDASVGVPYLQDLGMRYYLAVTPEAVAEAEEQEDLTLIRTAGPWHIYEVDGGDIVTPLTVQPVVVNERGGDQRERWLELGTSWYQNREEWAAVPVDDGPAEWQRIDVEPDLDRRVGTEPGADGRQVDVVVPTQQIEPVALDPVQVSDVVIGDETVSFSVDQIGVPVLVRVSYFPNWQVDGAEGPFRVAPNMMVVVPTDTEVRLHFDRSAVDVIAYLLTVAGIVLLFVLWRKGPVDYSRTPTPVPAIPSSWPLTSADSGVTTAADDAGPPWPSGDADDTPIPTPTPSPTLSPNLSPTLSPGMTPVADDVLPENPDPPDGSSR